MSYTLVGGNFTRTYPTESLASYSVKLLASQQSYFKVDGGAFILLDPKGSLFVLQVDGTSSTPGRVLFENYNFGWNRAVEHSVELTDKSGLPGTYTLSQALAAHGHTFTTLDALHALVIAEPPPGPPRYWSVDNSEDITQLVRKSIHNHAHRSTYLAPPEEHLSVQTKRQTITHYNSYTHASTVDNLVVTALDLAGLYLENVDGGTRYRLGVTSQRPVITIVNGNSISVEAGSTWTDPGSSAVDEDGTTLQVTITGDTVDTPLLTGGTPYQVVYTAVSSSGDRNLVVRQVHVVDTTSPTIVPLPHSSGDINPSLDVGDAWVDPGYTATADGSWESITHSQSGTVDVNTPGSYPLVVTANDGTNSASITRTIQIRYPVPTPDHYIAGPTTSATTYDNMVPTSRTSVSICFWMLGPANPGVLWTAWGATHADQQAGHYVYGCAGYAYSTNRHWGHGWGSGHLAAGPVHHVFDVDVSRNPSRIRMYKDGPSTPWAEHQWEISRDNADLAPWSLPGNIGHNGAGTRSIRDVRVYDRVLTAAERVQLSNAPP